MTEEHTKAWRVFEGKLATAYENLISWIQQNTLKYVN